MAFPTSSILKPIRRGYKAQVNFLHTKVGIARNSFRKRESDYRRTFGGEVEFRPVVQVCPADLPDIERILLQNMRLKYSRVGTSREWFDTPDRDEVICLITRLVSAWRTSEG